VIEVVIQPNLTIYLVKNGNVVKKMKAGTVSIDHRLTYATTIKSSTILPQQPLTIILTFEEEKIRMWRDGDTVYIEKEG